MAGTAMQCGQIWSLQAAFFVANWRIAYNPHCIVMHGSDFGHLVQWEKEGAHRWDMIPYPLAQLILRAQHIFSSFLRDVVDLLLAPEPQNATKGTTYWNQLVECGFSEKSRTIEKQPYRKPAFTPAPSFDLQSIFEMFKCRYECRQRSDVGHRDGSILCDAGAW
jgi:hypothetical protein